MTANSGSSAILRMNGITKRFPGTVALEGVSFDLSPGEVHCLVGENGAGKSTLVKILAGGYRADEGTIELDGVPIAIRSPADGLRQSIGVQYQELELIDELSVMENVFLGQAPRTRLGSVDWRAMRSLTVQAFAEMGFEIAPTRKVGRLSVAQRELVAIAKVLVREPRILVLDEPSAALAGADLEALFALVKRLRAKGVAVIYISHRLEEIFLLGDRVTVLRDGRVIETRRVEDVTESELIRLMVGRPAKSRFTELPAVKEDNVLLRVDGLSSGVVRNASFELRAGEILGCTGLAGAGLGDLAQTLVGIKRPRSGTITVQDQSRRLRPRTALAAGLALVPEDRKGQGLVLIASVANNMSYSVLPNYSRAGIIRFGKLAGTLTAYRDRLKIKTPRLGQPVGTLSGGNQQKVVLAKALSTNPRILILDEPTRGIDVGTKQDIYELIARLAGEGRAIVLMSSELDEVTALSHRLLVFSEGRIAATLERPYDPEVILRHALPKSLQVDEPSEAEALPA